MNFRVTVELDEGVKKSVAHSITTESYLVYSDPNTFEEAMKRIVAHAADNCLTDILGFFKEHRAILLQRNKNGVRETLRVEDIDNAIKWISEGDKK